MLTAEPEVGREVDVPADAIWDVLADGWSYPLWVVGATHMRAVDDAWPAQGACLHHSVGAWPAQFHDNTEVLAMEPGHRLTLQARLWPVGSARVVLTVDPMGTSTARVRIHEVATDRLGRLVPQSIQAPLINARNRETLARLADVARHRKRSSTRGG
jgi:uncharacterized protein YndB with AHSA1/START domain